MIKSKPTVEAKNVTIPAIGFGTWQIKGDKCKTMVEAALRHGYRHIDTAQIYENEDFVGSGLVSSKVEREEIFLTTKVWFKNFETSAFADSVMKSLKKLKTDYVDLLLLHWPKFESSMEETLDSLMKVKEEGKALNIGVSNFTESQLERAHSYTNGAIIANQVEYHPFLNQDLILGTLRKYNMALTAYSPLSQGAVFKSDILQEIAARHDVSAAEVTLAWLLSQNNVVAIPRTSSVEHMKSNLSATRLKLSKAELQQISALRSRNERIIDPGFSPDWD